MNFKNDCEGCCTSVAQTDSAPSSSSDGRKKITPEEIEFVQNLIERCLVLYMTKDEATTMLVNRTKIEPGFIHLVWQRLEEENPEFFEAYELRVELKKQIISYNQLLEKQYYLMNSDHYAMQQSVDDGHSHIPANSSIGFPAAQPYLPSRNGDAYMYPLCNGPLNHMINEVPTVSNVHLHQHKGDDQEKMATYFNHRSSVEPNEFLRKQAFLPNTCTTEKFHIRVDDSSHFNTTNDWINFEDHTAFENSHFSYSDVSHVKIEPPCEFDVDCLIADSPSTETQIPTDNEKP